LYLRPEQWQLPGEYGLLFGLLQYREPSVHCSTASEL
jgi:hypothetical protein